MSGNEQPGPVVDHGMAPLELSSFPKSLPSAPTRRGPTEITEFVSEPPVEPVHVEIEIVEPAEEVVAEPVLETEAGRVDESPRPRLKRGLPRARYRVGFWHVLWALVSGTVYSTVVNTVWFVLSLFGIATMILALAFISAVPLLNFVALGYLLEVEGRVARSGRLRDAFPLVSSYAPVLGALSLAVWVLVAPLRLMSDAAADARIIDPGSFWDIGLRLGVWGTCALLIWPLVLALLVLWRSGYWERAACAIESFIAGFRLRHHAWLGFRGFVGAFLWLVVPTAFFAIARKTNGVAILVTLFGGLLLVIVLSWLPFLQAHFAAENRFGAMFELRRVRKLYRNSPLCWLLSVVLTLVLALPLYLAKVVIPPADALWLVNWLFIVSIYPVKVLTGWAYHRAVAREQRAMSVALEFNTLPRPHAFFAWRWLCWLLMYPLLGMFVFILFFTQFIGEHGKGVLFEHHAFLLPVPF